MDAAFVLHLEDVIERNIDEVTTILAGLGMGFRPRRHA
jgi:hypothetical protein